MKNKENQKDTSKQSETQLRIPMIPMIHKTPKMTTSETPKMTTSETTKMTTSETTKMTTSETKTLTSKKP